VISRRTGLESMLAARSVALVGASPRPGTFGARMIEEVTRSPSRPRVHLVNPRYGQIDGRPCAPSLADLPGPADLVLLAVPDAALAGQLTLAARRGDRAAVIFGNAHEEPAGGAGGGTASPARGGTAGAEQLPSAATHLPRPALRERLAGIARSAGMELCGAGCMGFINVSQGLRAIGYTEPSPLPAGPVALVTHSGSVFSALLRARRGLSFSLAVSSGQELVTTAPAYLEYALELPETRVIALVLETMRDAGRLRAVLARAADRDLPVVLLTVGGSADGRAMVAAHSGALAAADGGWEALSRAHGVHRVSDLAELADTLELFAIGRRPPARHAQPAGVATADGMAFPASTAVPAGARSAGGIATVHDSGLERAHVADLADELGVPFAPLSAYTTDRLAGLLDPGLRPANPLDVWGTGADPRELFAGALTALADEPAVAAVALAVDLVHELDGDRSYPLALLDVAARTDKPLAVLSNLPSAIDPELAAELRAAGIPVLESTRTGLLALRHLLDHAAQPRPAANAGNHQPNQSAAQAGDHQPNQSAAQAGDHQPNQSAAQAGDHQPNQSAAHAGDDLRNQSGGDTGDNQRNPSGADTGDDQPARPAVDRERQRRGRELLASGAVSGAPLLGLLREYGISTARVEPASDAGTALAAAAAIGYPVVLKTDEPAITHKSDVRGVLLGIADPAALAAGYADLAARLGPRVLVGETAPPGTELALGLVADPGLGPLIVVGAGGVLVELLADRVVALPPVDERQAAELIGRLRVSQLLAGVRGAPAADLGAVARAITGLSQLACELGDDLAALDVNPLICGPAAAVAVDALAIPRPPRQ
jgi:acetate---CoA ligase (ADP-forming)